VGDWQHVYSHDANGFPTERTIFANLAGPINRGAHVRVSYSIRRGQLESRWLKTQHTSELGVNHEQ
jgi:hypothetical protein